MVVNVPGRNKHSHACLKLSLFSEPKEKIGKDTSVQVELLPNSSFACPIRAMSNFMRDSKPLGKEYPVFSDGCSLLTGQRVNIMLRKLLKKHVDYDSAQILGHSFRAGVTSALARVGASKEVNTINVLRYSLNVTVEGHDVTGPLD